MKRLTLLAVAFALSTIGAFAQGTLTFANVVTLNPIPYVVWGSDAGAGNVAGTRISAAGDVKVGLYYNDALVSAPVNIGRSSTGTINAAFDGRFNGPGVTIPGLAAGQSGTFVVKAWSGSFTTYELAAEGGALYGGVSTPFSNPTGGVPDPVTGVPGLPASLTGFTSPLSVNALVPIPEPSTFALAGLGLGALLLIRRRK